MGGTATTQEVQRTCLGCISSCCPHFPSSFYRSCHGWVSVGEAKLLSSDSHKIRNTVFVGTGEEGKRPLRPDRAIGIDKDSVRIEWAQLGVGVAALPDDISETKSDTGTQKDCKLFYQGAIAAFQKLDLRDALSADGADLHHPHPLVFCNSFVVCPLLSSINP